MTASSTNHQEQPRLLFFGDLGGCQLIDSLRELLHVKDSANLDAFFAQVSFRLRRHIGSLPTSQRDAFPRFTTLVDLVSRYEEASGRGALQLFFWNIFQSAEFIRSVARFLFCSHSPGGICSMSSHQKPPHPSLADGAGIVALKIRSIRLHLIQSFSAAGLGPLPLLPSAVANQLPV